MDAGLISTIVNAATGLSTAFIQFGANVYAVNHTPLPVADEYNYNIIVPPKAPQSAFSPGIVILVVIIVAMLLIAGFIAYKLK